MSLTSNKIQVSDNDAIISAHKVMSAKMAEMLNLASTEANQLQLISTKKINTMLKFLEECEENGLGHTDFIEYVKDGLEMCKEKKDTRTYKLFLDLWRDLTLTVESDLTRLLEKMSVEVMKNSQSAMIVNNKDEPTKLDMENELKEIEVELQEDVDETEPEAPPEVEEMYDEDEGY